MDDGLDGIIDELAEAEFDDGLTLFATLMLTASVSLAILVQVPTSPVWAGLLMLPAALLVAGLHRRQRGRLRARQRIEDRTGLDFHLLQRCAGLGQLEPEDKALVGQVLGLVAALHHVARRPVAQRLEPEALLDLADAAADEALTQAEGLLELAGLAELCSEAVRTPGRLDGLRARLMSQRAGLAAVVDALEELLVAAVEAVAAAAQVGHGDQSALVDLRRSAQRLRRSLSGGRGVERLSDVALGPATAVSSQEN